jgi:hypothetical protein
VYRPIRMSSAYHFVTVWRVPGTIAEVKDVLGNADTLPQWWPAVYLSVNRISEGGADYVGSENELHTKGWLPYTLKWNLTLTEPMTDSGFALAASGDLNGTGVWTFEQDGPEVVITYDWRVQASKPLLRRLAWLLKPAFAANHHWAMKTGEESLRLEMRRRRATSDEERRAIPPPPPATFRRLLRG